MKIVAKKDRKLLLINTGNTQNENKAETIELTVPEEYEDYNKKIVFVTDDGIVWDIIQDNTYKLTNAITKYKQVDFYIWLTKDDVDFRSKTMPLRFYHNEDASDEITDEEIHGVNTVVNLLEEEIEKVENLNIEATKVGNAATITITKKDGTTQSVNITDGQNGQDGQDGKDGQDGQDGQPGQDGKDAKINGKNSIEIEAGNNIIIEDTESGIRISSTGGRNNNDGDNTKAKIFGVEFDLLNETSIGTRIADSVGLQNDYVVGNEFQNGGKNDFDKVYPFSDIRKCNVIVTPSGENIITYEGEENFRVDGGNGNVMMEIPKFYFYRERVNNKERWLISGTKHPNFKPAPLFVDDDGIEIDYAYIACYECTATPSNQIPTDSIPNNYTNYRAIRSIPNLPVQSGFTLEQYVQYASRFSNTSLFNFGALATIQMLWCIEFADRDVKAYMPGIGFLPYFSSSNNPSIYTEENANQITVEYSKRVVSLNIGTKVILCNGTKAIGTGNHYITSKIIEGNYCTFTFDGQPVNITAGTTFIAGCPQDTGKTDALQYHTGRITGNPNLSAFKYREMENLWGNAWHIVAGLRIKNLKYYYTNEHLKFTQNNVDNWNEYSIPAPYQPNLGDDGNNRAWIIGMGYDRSERNVLLPSECVGESTSTSYDGKYYSAGIYTYNDLDKIYVCTQGGAFDHNLLCSPFTLRFWFGIGGDAALLHTTRLVVRNGFKKIPSNKINLSDYYKKDESYSRTEINDMIGSTRVDLTDYIKNTDYATSSKSGVFKVSNGAVVGSTGYITCSPKTFNEYNNLSNNYFISKGTLENVLRGYGLIE